MPKCAQTRRVFLIASPDKPEAAQTLDRLAEFAASRCNVVARERGLDAGAAAAKQADRVIVVGGDGTLIGVARSLGDDQIPLIGVNVGKLGFLTEFSFDELVACFDQAICDDALINRRAILQARVQPNNKGESSYIAINDCVIQAGSPHRLITLGLRVNNVHLTELRADGLIVCTPSGSTAYNLSAGGPILEAGVDAMVVTPLNPHSLTHKPLVIESEGVVDILAIAVNPGTTVLIDGQMTCPFRQGDSVTVRRFDKDVKIVRNPGYHKWHNLITKLHWGQPPEYA